MDTTAEHQFDFHTAPGQPCQQLSGHLAKGILYLGASRLGPRSRGLALAREGEGRMVAPRADRGPLQALDENEGQWNKDIDYEGTGDSQGQVPVVQGPRT